MDPTRHNAHKNLGVALEGRRRLAEVAAAYTAAVHADPLDEVVVRKKYLYALRAIFALRWLERGLGAVPIEFGRLMETVPSEAPVQGRIGDLIMEKRGGSELGVSAPDPILRDSIDGELSRLENVADEIEGGRPDESRADELFRQALREIWGEMLPD